MAKLKFIDLFAGIGGTRLAFERVGCQCVFSSEIDPQAAQTYKANFGSDPRNDITKTCFSAIPTFDILVAGFPCQAFSIAGRRRGFNDTRGTLFFEVARILRDCQPSAFLLENVKGLANHDKRKTLTTILSVLRNDLHYYVPEPEILNSKDFGVPQNRERIIIVGFRDRVAYDAFSYPSPVRLAKKVRDILETAVPAKYYLSERYYRGLERHRQKHESKGNGFGYQILDPDGISNAVVCGGMGRERNLVVDQAAPILSDNDRLPRRNDRWIRKLTPRECARLQGFPEDFVIPVADTHAYKQFGNTVTVPLIQAVAARLLTALGEGSDE